MRTHWTVFGIAAIIGAIAAVVRQRGMGGNPMGLTGGFAKPFQPGIRYPG